MKRFLVLGAVSIVGAIIVVTLIEAYFLFLKQPEETRSRGYVAPVVALQPLPDVDSLAQRVPVYQDVYQKLRDEALAAYAKQHPGTHPYDAEARETLKLASYLVIWDDFYGEGLWLMLDRHAEHLTSEGCADQVWLSLRDLVWGPHAHSSTGAGVNQVNACANRLGASPYPAAFRLAAYRMAVMNMIVARKSEPDTTDLTASMAALPDLTAKATACYGEMIAQHPSNAYLYASGRKFLNGVDDDHATLVSASKGLDEAFLEHDRNNPTANVLDALFYIDVALRGRGAGYADTVTEKGWIVYHDNMKHAGDMLTDLYARTPQQPGLARCMMNVMQAEEQPRDQMELWFQRAMQVNPNDYDACQMKEYYLLPRWYGTEEDEWAFEMECVKGGNWAAKIPMIIVDELKYRFDSEKDVYAQPEVWEPLEKIYREFLTRYPNSVHYRSLFALNAAQGAHWDVAKEQFKILGGNWDRDVFPDSLYGDTRREVSAH